MAKLFPVSLLAFSGSCAANVLRGGERQRPGGKELHAEVGSEEILGFPGDVDIYCHIYSDEHDAGGKWMLEEDPEIFDRLGLDDSTRLNTSAALDAVMRSEEMEIFSKKMRAACLGSAWDGKRCQELAMAIRHFFWPRIKDATPGRAFQHLRNHGRAPPILTFRMGGGVTADVPCREGNPAHLYFRHIYKAAGYAIKKNLARLSNTPPDDFIDDNWFKQDYCDKLGYATEHTTPKPVLFTFIRDPMEKFIAGYKEISARGEFKTFPAHGPKTGSKEHARLFLNNVWHGSCDNGHVVLQVQSMMGPACESQFDFVGKLESFEEDWQRVGKAAGCTRRLGWPEEWAHPSEKDDKGADAAMRAVLAENGGALARALCLWLMPDYIALDYPVPKVCGR